MNVLLCGATGLVGSECLRIILSDPRISEIKAIGRRPLGLNDPKLKEFIIDFNELEKCPEAFKADAIICALGTTIKKAGSQKNFKVVDYEYPLRIAKMGLLYGAKHFLLVSAIGANSNSRIFYNRVKGEAEAAITALPYEKITILRPSLLIGDRKEFRLGEELGKRFAFLFPAKYKANKAVKVAQTLVNAVESAPAGTRVISSEEINRVSRD